MRPSPKPKKRKPAYAAKPNPETQNPAGSKGGGSIGVGAGVGATGVGGGGGGKHIGVGAGVGATGVAPSPSGGGSVGVGAGVGATGVSGPSPSSGGSKPAPSYAPSSGGLTEYAKQVLGLSPAESSIVPYAVSAGQKYGVSPALLMGLMENQSGLKPQARIGKESGLGMFGPQSRKDYGVKEGDDEVAIKTQVNGLAKMLSESGVNENPREAIAMWARGEHRGFAEKVIQTAEHYEALDPQKPQGSINAQLGGQGVQAAQRAAATQQPSPVNTERPAPGQPVRRDPNDPMDGPVNTERPDPRSGDSLRALNPALKTINQALAQVNGTQPTPEQKARVKERLLQAVKKADPAIPQKYATLGPASKELAEAAVKYGKEFGIDPSFLMGIAEIETGFGAAAGSGTAGAGAVSSAGAQGYMQFMPASRDQVLQETGYDAFSKDPKEAMAAAAGYFSVFAPDAQSNWDRAYSYNHAGWYADEVTANAEKYKDLDNLSAGKNVNPALVEKAKETLGKLNTQAIVKGIDTSAAQKINDPVQRRAVKQIMVTGRVTQEDARVLGPAAAKALARGGNLVNAPSGKHKLVAAEMFYDGGGSYYDNGTWTEGQFGGHGDHVHFASEDPISMMLVVKKAQELGMLQGGVGENPAYDTIDAHDPNSGSYHVRSEPMPNGPYAKKLEKATGASGDVIGQAIDIAGSPEQMGQMRDWIAAHIGKDATLTGPKIKGTDLMVVEPAPEATPTEGLSGASGSSLPGLAGATGGWTQREFKKNGSALPAQPTGINASSAGAIFGKSFAGMNPELVPSLAGVLPASSEGDGSSMIDALVRVSNPRRRVRTR